MVNADLNISVRSDLGSRPSSRLRNAGLIPGIIYGFNVENQSVQLEKKQIEGLIKEHGENVLVGLNIDTQNIQTLIKEVQRDPLTNQIIHIDFQSINLDKPVQATIPVILRNRGAVEDSNSVVQQLMREVTVECLPENIPENVALSVKDLAMGSALTVSDIEISSEISILNNPTDVIASLIKSNSKIEEDTMEEADMIVSSIINSDGTIEE